ncbi:sperm-tail PG-rich repeat-containing protein 2-like [Vespula squamosa]|uniref:Sperm-tail PG-rich repeat-containing protein 2-like n=1 Tax=Vespula squamosa TaxID=30214 RepID=A0ABD2A7N1_VESSQ
MAYNRAERFPKLITQTPARVGPGTYDGSFMLKPPRDLDCRYPFLNSTQRETLTISRDTILFPGPGSYDPIEPQRHIPERRIGGVSIDYTEVRLKEKIYEGPGPTEYDLPDDLLKKTQGKIRSHPGTWKGAAGKLWLIKPPRSIITPGISVPSKRDVYGYDINEYGILVKISPIEHEPPFIYDIPRGEENFTTLRYKGNFWSRMTGREEKKPFVTPGPGDYEHETKKSPTQIYDEKFREIKKATSRQPRFLEAMYRRKLREGFPGPNHYDPPKSTFERYKKIDCKCDKYTLEPPPFYQTAERFEHTECTDSPGPGTYDIKKPKCTFAHICEAPFGSFVSRFKDVADDKSPAPDKYDIVAGNISYESAKRFKYSCERSIPRSTPKKIVTPYSKKKLIDKIEKVKPISEKSYVHHAVFKSRTERFRRVLKGIDAPDPGAYEALTSFKANRDRCDFLCRRLAPPFLSSARRVLEITKGIDMTVPASTHYTILYDISKGVKGGVISYSRCDKEKKTKIPGPQYYCINPYIESSVLKKSFNVTLGKEKFVGETKKVKSRLYRGFSKKTLRWFATPLKDYRHCPITCLTVSR